MLTLPCVVDTTQKCNDLNKERKKEGKRKRKKENGKKKKERVKKTKEKTDLRRLVKKNIFVMKNKRKEERQKKEISWKKER